jgi:hypothetical protein
MIDELTKMEISGEVEQETKPATVREALSESGESVGIEVDDADDLIEPFDPDLISIEQRVVTMDALIRRLKQGSIRLKPNFQRNEVWKDGQRSRLIESIILRIPLPMFYVALDVEGRWDVVDGLQRLSTIRNFVLGDEKKEKLRLEGLEFLGERLNGKTFDDIDIDNPTYQRMINTIMETEMRFTIINPSTPEEVKRNVFKRLNTGGLPLTAQEIRHALYQGQVTDLLVKLAESKSFKEATDRSINDSRMAARELVLYFMAFAVFPYSAYRGNMDTWLSNAMRVINLMPNLEQSKLIKIFGSQESIPEIKIKTIEELTQRFELAMTRGVALFGKHAFRKSLPIKGYRRTPINKALFETWGNILSELNESDFVFLSGSKKLFINACNILLNGEPGMLDSIGAFSTNPEISEDFQIARKIIFFVFGENILYYHPNEFDIGLELKSEGIEWSILNLLRGSIGESLNLSISRNASKAESVKRRYLYLGNLVKNTIIYEKQGETA